MQFDLIIFDCDGVLINSEPISLRVLIEALAELGLHLTYEEAVSTFVGKSLTSNRLYVEERIGKPLSADFSNSLQDRVLEVFKSDLLPIEGIHKALEHIVQPVCVASSSNKEWIHLALEIVGLLPRFENGIFSASQVKHGKPAPDVYLYAAEQMGVSPSKCAVIEDSPTGVEAGANAGMTVFGYTGTFAAEELLRAGAHHIFHQMNELPQLLKDKNLNLV
jgi:HAD superfamily hydrolase (TIGR01509 family)